MLKFQFITPETADIVQKYYENCDYRLCEYSVGVKLMWSDWLHAEFVEAAGCLIVKSCTKGRCQFDFPIPGPEGDVEGALRLIEQWCTENGCRMASVFSAFECNFLCCFCLFFGLKAQCDFDIIMA